MPLYAYHCSECEDDFDVIRKFSDDSLVDCPKCSATLGTEAKVVSKTSFKLDGSGWFKEGYDTKKNNYSFQK